VGLRYRGRQINQRVAEGRLTRTMQVFLDSPMAISATEISARDLEYVQPQAARLFRSGQDPLRSPGFHFTRERAESAPLNNVHNGAVISSQHHRRVLNRRYAAGRIP